MQKLPQHITYEIAKISFGIYLVDELRSRGGKEFPTETDVKKILLRVNPACSTTELQTARQISRYCQTGKNYLKDAKEETLDKVAKAINAPIGSFATFRDKVNPLLKAFKYYSHYVERAEAYLKLVEEQNQDVASKMFRDMFECVGGQKAYLSMISYNFGELNKELPAVSFGAESDLRTERIVRSLFDNFNLPAPQYLPENAFFSLLHAQAAKTTYIAIGLFGNRLTEWLNVNGCLGPVLQILPAEKCILINGTHYFANREEGTDYALFCKYRLGNGSTVIIIGGIEGVGTQCLGEYLQQNWHIMNALIDGKDNVILLYKTSGDVVLLEKAL